VNTYNAHTKIMIVTNQMVKHIVAENATLFYTQIYITVLLLLCICWYM